MKTTLLLPNGFKKIGWAIFVPAFLLGCSICFFGENFDRWLFRETVMNNIAIIGTVVGALFIGFSREKIEDEMIQHIRLNALMAAMWINYLLLIVVSLSIYNIDYLTVMACGMATPLVIFLLVYHFNLYKLNRNLHHEEYHPRPTGRRPPHPATIGRTGRRQPPNDQCHRKRQVHPLDPARTQDRTYLPATGRSDLPTRRGRLEPVQQAR